jgi:extracellular elastinolytic metalloproteinase
MKNLLLTVSLVMTIFLVFGQDLDRSKALGLIYANKDALGLSIADIQSSDVSNAYVSTSSGLSYVYLQQSYQHIPIYNSIQSLGFLNGKLVSQTGNWLSDLDEKTGGVSVIPAVRPEEAVLTAFRLKKISNYHTLIPSSLIPGRKFSVGKAGVATENITAELMWVPIDDGKKVKLAWQVYLVPAGTADYWMIRIDAHTNTIIDENNLTVFCFGENNHARNHTAFVWESPKINQKNLLNSSEESFLQTTNSIQQQPMIINGASYRVVPFPYESPAHAPGNQALVTNPWDAAPGNATSLKWHSTGTTDYNYTRGNNVWAQEDVNGNNGTGTPATSTTTGDPLSFNFVPDFTAAPTQTAGNNNQAFNTTNLFYWNNIVHDITYRYGFDEPAGNFQFNNQGRGGAGNDLVLADAQDGSGTNNANFSTPPDGGSGRMQMYLWNSVPTLTVNTPATIAGQYQAVESNFSTANKLSNVGQRTGDVVYYNDNAAGTTHEACAGVPSNSVLGKIALIDRGNCNFTVKVKNAQIAGAIAVIMVNNVSGSPIIMGGTDNTITIPAVMISINDGQTLKNQLSNNLNVTLAVGPQRDGDVDNGVIVHEFTHGISNRLTGGPAQASCLANAEQMGEGWSDYYALMLTQNWATANLNSGFQTPRGIGTYVIGQLPNQLGIRTQVYSTDLDVNNKVFANTITTAVHERGEIWCATLWDMTWNIINQVGVINSSIYDTSATGGNSIALKLVTEAMKLQPCSPGFIDGRNALLKADSILYGSAHQCAIWEAFRRRGMGLYATQGSSNSVTDQVADYTPLVKITKNQNTVDAVEGQTIIYTTTVSSCSPVTNYVLRDTLPTNITYVSGGTYDAGSRVVSFPVNFTTGQTQTFSYTVTVNAGSYFTTDTVLQESVTGTSIPASFSAASTTANTWSVSNTFSQSTPNAFFTPNSAAVSDQTLANTNSLNIGSNTSSLQFSHRYNTESGFDGGTVEISTNNGTSWIDLSNEVTSGYPNAVLASGSSNPIAGRLAWSGNNGGFMRSSVNLSRYSGQNIRFRFRFGSNNSNSGNGWYVDDLLVKKEPIINIRTNLFNASGVRMAYNDTVTRIVQVVTCVSVSVNAQPPASLIACAGSDASITVNADGSNPSYQWQESADNGNTYTNINGATASTLTITGVTQSMNNRLYRVLISNNCPSTATSTATLLTVQTPAAISAQPQSVGACEGTNVTFGITATGSPITYQWQVSTNGGSAFTNITGATGNTYTLSSVSASLNANQYQVVLSGCAATPLTSSPATLTVSNQTSISLQPATTLACSGNAATFVVNAIGGGLSYQWQVSTDGGITYNNIPAATAATLTLNAVSSLQNGYQYRVIISSTCSADVTSQSATLQVSDPPLFTLQPGDITVCEGQLALFNAVVSATNPSYQWQVSTDGGNTYTNIAGATGSAYNVTSVSAGQNNYQYRVLVFSCDATGIASNPALLTVNTPASFVSQPTDQSVCEGATATFSAGTAGTAVTYQWQISTDNGATFTDLNGETNAILQINNAVLAINNNQYRVLLTNPCSNNIASLTARLTVNQSASVGSDPSGVSVCPGNSASFTVSATGPGLTYQWQFSNDGGANYNNISGASTATYTINAVSSSQDNYLYRALIGSSCAAQPITSAAAVLRVLAAATITENPADTTVCTGGTATFRVVAQATNNTYQWQVSTDGGSTFTNINGAVNPTYTVSTVGTSQNNHQYRVVITGNPCGATSTQATLFVFPTPIVTLTASPIQQLYPGLTTTLTANAIPSSNDFEWYKDGIRVPGVQGRSITVDFSMRGRYQAKAIGLCDNQSNELVIGDSATSEIFIYPNPTAGPISIITYHQNTTSGSILIQVYDAKGAKVIQQSANRTSGYNRYELDMTFLASGIYILEILDENGNRLYVRNISKK